MEYQFSIHSNQTKCKAIGELNKNAKLTKDDVLRIRANIEGYNPTQWARKYNVSHCCITRIIKHHSWRHL